MNEPAKSIGKPSADDHDAAVDAHEMPFMGHLLELRSRLLRAIGAVALLFLPIYGLFGNELYEFVAMPLLGNLPGGEMIATDVASPFFAPLKLSLFAALFAGMPFVLHQAWAFVAPGLYLREKRLVLPLLSSSIALFYLGMLFAHFVVFPLVFAFFASVTPEGVSMMTDINSYLNFVLKMYFAFGLAFEIPIATSILVWSGFSTPASLARKRPYVVVGCFVAGMLLTPPDVISQVLLALPTWMLFEVGILVARLIRPVEEPSSEHPPATT